MKYIFIFILTSITFLGFSQNKLKGKTEEEQSLFRHAYKHIRQKKYTEARLELEAILHKIDSTEFDANYDLGHIFLERLNDPEHALKYLIRANNSSDPVDEQDFYYLLAKCYEYDGQYDKAFEYYSKYKKINFNHRLKPDIDERINSSKWAKEHKNDKNNWVKIVNLGNEINNELAEYTPVFDQHDSILLFTTRHSDNTGEKKDHWDNLYYEDMFFTHGYKEKMKPSHKFDLSDKYVSHVHNTNFHDAIVSISPNRSKLYTFHNNKLYESKIINHQELEEPVKMSKKINIGKYQNHASITSDENTIYFTSEKKSKSLGGLDIFVSEKNKNGKWGKAKNIGVKINTPYNEESPLISPDGKMLFFGSKGHDGFGGYDMYVSYKNEKEEWSTPQNLGVPINSGGDDLYPFLMDTSIYSHGYGYISSSRKGGHGQMDIYFMEYFARPEFKRCGKNMRLIHSENEIDSVNYIGFYTTEDTISIDKPTLFDASISKLEGYNVDKHWWQFGDSSDSYYERESTIHTYRKPGIYNILLEIEAYPLQNNQNKIRQCVNRKVIVLDESSYKDFVEKRMYRDSISDSKKIIDEYEDYIKKLLKGKNLTTEEIQIIRDSLSALKINSNEKEDIVENIVINLKPIFFDYDKSNIRLDANTILKDNLAILRQYKSINIKIIAHTDARGSNEYNIKLSEKRAISTYNWLTKNGIERDRIKSVNFKGEEELSNDCTNTSNCEEDQHQLNRRADLVVVP